MAEVALPPLPPSLFSPKTSPHHYRTTLLTPPSRHYVCQRGLRCPDSFPLPDLDESDEEGRDCGESRNQKKRKARRATSPSLPLGHASGIASLEEDVFEALMLVERFGPGVREGKRRQFNDIGKLLREVEPKLMDTLIRTTKDSDTTRLRALSASDAWISNDVGDDDAVEDYMGENEID